MPACAINGCKKSSKTSNLQRDGITFHLFPRNLYQRQKWTEVCNRPVGWTPTYSSSICSRHFHISQFQDLPNSRRVLVKNAVPSLLLLRHELDIVNMKEGSQRNILHKVLFLLFQSTTAHKIRNSLSKNLLNYQKPLPVESCFTNRKSNSMVKSKRKKDLEVDIQPFEYLQNYVKELLPENTDDNAIFVIIVNNEENKTSSDSFAEMNGIEPLAVVKTEMDEDTASVEQELRRRVAQKCQLADERHRKIRSLTQARRRLLRRNAHLTKIIVKLKTQNIVKKDYPIDDTINVLNSDATDSEDYIDFDDDISDDREYLGIVDDEDEQL